MSVFDNPTVTLRPLSMEPCKYSHASLIFPETRITGLHFFRFLIVWVYLHSIFLVRFVRRFFLQECILAVQGHPVIDFGRPTNIKSVCDFLLVCHSNLGPMLHRFGDIADFCVHDPTSIPP